MKRQNYLYLLALLAQISFAQLPPGFAKFEIADELNPTDLAIAPDGRVFITEKDGLVRIVEDGQLLPDAFIILDLEDFNEQGLGHIALDPDFPTQPFVYLYYTVADTGGLSHNKVVRVSALGNLAVPGSEQVVYECDPSYGTVHNGGDLVFGQDGKLYISTGDKGRGSEVQSMSSDLGKVLRINPDGSIPADNPFYQTTFGKYRAIYALGMRNPFSVAVQPETGRIFACDVGNALWEEIDDILPGMNYGHPIIEGMRINEPEPANYKDPWYSYHHSEGCSIIGAAFMPSAATTFPASYRGQFFFADYCKGYIKMIDPDNSANVDDFASDIDRPVAMAISPTGDFYYLARSGIGGGSEVDNTESESGSLWRVVYTGTEAPFVYKEPKDALRVVGEDCAFEARALGRAPLHYRWQKNGADLNAPDSSILDLSMLSLADSNSAYRCIISNMLGQDTSDTAILAVTNNQRPILTILSPASDFRYKAGTFLPYSGIAIDPETGPINPINTAWKVDFHHDEHAHPAMGVTTNISSDSFWIAALGEPSENVWYRLYYSATDTFGLSKTIFVDIHPQLSPVSVHCDASSVPVNADGFTGNTPYLFYSVAGFQRNLTVPDFMDLGDSVLLFKQWDNGMDNSTHAFTTPDTGTYTVTAEYDKVRKSNGFGLLGEYFNETMQPYGFDEELLLSRIDSSINFEWQEGSPDPGYVPIDGFTVRWTGKVVPYVDDTLTFYTFTDDGARLWVNDSLLIDEWQAQPGIEYSGRIFLEGGEKHAIRFEFLEAGGAATAKLMWSSKRIPKMPIPQRQLYPPSHLVPNRLSGSVWLDLNKNDIWDAAEVPVASAAVLAVDANNQLAVAAALTDANGYYELPSVLSGTYYLKVLPPLELGAVSPGFGLSASGNSATFSMDGEADINQDFAFSMAVDTGNNDLDFQAWSVSPNPTSGILYFRKKLLSYQDSFHILVFDANGKLCLETDCPANTWEKKLDLSAFGSGIYIVKVGSFAVKVLVH